MPGCRDLRTVGCRPARARRVRWPVVGTALLVAVSVARAQPLPETAIAPWIWAALLALLLLTVLAMAALCLSLLRREQRLRQQLDSLREQRQAVHAAAPPEAPPGAAPVAAAGAAAPAVDPAADAATSEAGEVDHDQESFSYTVSHDLRAPIRVVEGFTRILKEDYGRVLDRVGNDHLDRVLGAAARMNNMIDAMLALSRLSSQPVVRQPVNLSQLASYVADDLRKQSPDREASVRIEDGMQVIGDPVLLRVVIENLLGNAWKYTANRERAEISFQRHPRDSHTFTISDNGAGFDMRFADRLFGVFQRLHSANDFPGNGIGLASVRRVLRRHHGEIWAESEVDQGARFHFSIKLD